MEMNELRYFLAVAETQNIHRASENINVSAGSLSKAITRLENELKVKLFSRVGRGIALTQEGNFFKAKAQEILNLEVETKIGILGQETSFKALIGGEETLLSYFGVELAQKIKGLYNNSQIELRVLKHNELESKINDGEINLGISTEKPDGEIKYRKINEVKFYTIVGKGHPLYTKAKSNKEITIQEVLEYNFIGPQNNILGKVSTHQSNDGWRDDKFPRKRPFLTNSLKTIESFVSKGIALAYLPDYMILDSKFEILNITGCPYQCKQTVYLLSRNKKELGWINQIL